MLNLILKLSVGVRKWQASPVYMRGQQRRRSVLRRRDRRGNVTICTAAHNATQKINNYTSEDEIRKGTAGMRVWKCIGIAVYMRVLLREAVNGEGIHKSVYGKTIRIP